MEVTIFDRIVTKEDDCTQLLCNLCELDDDVRHTILKELLGREVSDCKMEPQYTLPDGTRPDMRIRGKLASGKEFEDLVEVKIEAPVQESQQEEKAYAQYVNARKKDGTDARLVFLVPEKRCGEVCADRVVSWKKLIETVEKCVVESRAKDLAAILKHAAGILNARCRPYRVALTQEETNVLQNKAVPGTILKLFEFIDKLRSYLNGKQCGTTVLKCANIRRDEEYGFYFGPEEVSCSLYLGCWFKAWQENGLPLCLAYKGKEVPSFIRPADFRTEIDGEQGKWKVRPIEMAEMGGDSLDVAELWKLIRDIIETAGG